MDQKVSRLPPEVRHALIATGQVWRSEPVADGVWRLRRSPDGLELLARATAKGARLSFSFPPRHGRHCGEEDWADVHGGDVPSAVSVTKDGDATAAGRRLAEGLIPRAEALRDALAQAAAADADDAAKAALLLSRLRAGGARVLARPGAEPISGHEPVRFRMYGKFAGEGEVRPDGTVSVRFQEMRPGDALRLFSGILGALDEDREPRPGFRPRAAEKPPRPPTALTDGERRLFELVSEEPMTKAEAARRLGVSRQAVGQTASRLVEAGLLAVDEHNRLAPTENEED